MPTLPSIAEEAQLPSLEWTEWSGILSQLPLFPPAAQPPASLYPHISPLLTQKLGLLPLARGRDWPCALTWLSPDLSYKVNERLKSCRLADGLQHRFRGYRRFDDELVLLEPYAVLTLHLDNRKYYLGEGGA
jgi:hypothetical protein